MIRYVRCGSAKIILILIQSIKMPENEKKKKECSLHDHRATVQNIKFLMIQNRGKRQILISQQLEPVKFWCFCLINPHQTCFRICIKYSNLNNNLCLIQFFHEKSKIIFIIIVKILQLKSTQSFLGLFKIPEFMNL